MVLMLLLGVMFDLLFWSGVSLIFAWSLGNTSREGVQMGLLGSFSMFRFFFFSSGKMPARLGYGRDVKIGNSVVVTTLRVATTVVGDDGVQGGGAIDG